MKIMILPNIAAEVSSVGIGVWDDGVHMDSLSRDGAELGRKAIADMDALIVRLYGRGIDGHWYLLETIEGETKGELGLWATWFCQGLLL